MTTPAPQGGSDADADVGADAVQVQVQVELGAPTTAKQGPDGSAGGAVASGAAEPAPRHRVASDMRGDSDDSDYGDEDVVQMSVGKVEDLLGSGSQDKEEQRSSFVKNAELFKGARAHAVEKQKFVGSSPSRSGGMRSPPSPRLSDPPGSPRSAVPRLSLDGSQSFDGLGKDESKTLPNTPMYHVTWIVSGVVMSLLKYVFCVVGAVIIHDVHPTLQPTLAIGVGVQCASTLITCLITSGWSKIGINISGPDIIAALFVSQWAKILTDDSTTAVQQEQALPTILFLIFMSTLIMGAVWLLIGYTGATRIVDFMPQPVVSGFLGCIGYKVIKYSIKVSVGHMWYYPDQWAFWRLLLPALPIGLPLYLLKKYHLANPMIVLPFFLVVPTLIFFIAVFSTNQDFDKLREVEWLFPAYERREFYELWTALEPSKIAWSKIPDCLPDMAIMIIILVIDSLLKLASTKTALKIPVDMAHELKLTGWENVVTAFSLGAPGYPQVKFNVLSFGILGNTMDRKVGVFVGIFCGIMWLSGFMLINYLPRFLLGGLLLYAACPFIVDNLIVSYFHMSRQDFAAIWVIVLTVFIADINKVSAALLIAVIVGLLLAALIFMFQYARVSVIRDVASGADVHSKVLRTYWEEALLSRCGMRTGIIQLEGFIFFASAAQILQAIKSEIAKGKSRSYPMRLRYFIIDFEHVVDIDFSGIRTLQEVKRIMKTEDLYCIFTGIISDGLAYKLAHEGVLGEEAGYTIHEEEDLDRGAERIENLILARAAKLRSHWLIFDSFAKLHTEAQLRVKFQIFEVVLGSDIGGKLWKYAELKEIKAGEFICEEGNTNYEVVLLQRGRITSYTALEDGTIKRLRTAMRGAVINDECLFLDLPVAHSTIADEDSVLWIISKTRMHQMERLDPKLALAIHRHMLRHSSMVRHRLEHEIHSLEHVGQAMKKASKISGARNYTAKLGAGIITKIRDFHEHAMHPDADFTVEQRAHEEKKDIERHHESLTAETPAGAEATLVRVDNSHHKHHFRHIHKALSQPDMSVLGGSAGGEGAGAGAGDPGVAMIKVKPHLSSIQEQNARKWFRYHARDAEMGNQTLNLDVVTRAPSGDLSKARQDGTSISLSDVQKAIMDLGLFPTISEIRRMHKILDRELHGSGAHNMYVDEPEFIRMVEVLTLAELSDMQVRSLWRMFTKYGKHAPGSSNQSEFVLDRFTLMDLMERLGHPEDEIEIECIMHEWDLKNRGFLDFDAFVSVVATYLKVEELDVKVESDFMKLCGLSTKEMDKLTLAAKDALKLKPDQLFKAIKKYGGRKGRKVTMELAQEMIFDADIGAEVDKEVSLDELITCLEMIQREEVLDVNLDQDSNASSETKKNSMWRAPSGRHLSFGLESEFPALDSL